MDKFLKAKYCLTFFFLSTTFSVFAQTDKTPASDDEFNIFLFALATVFACLLIGAAIVGAFVAALFFLSLFALISFGVVSASIAVGLYKRSVATGFKTLLLIVFGTGCAGLGIILAFFFHTIFAIPISSQTTLFLGFAGGALGGIMMGLVSYTIVQTLLKNVVHRLRFTQ